MRGAIATVCLLLAGAGASAAQGAVLASSPAGFTIEHKARIAATPQAVWAVLVRPAEWWSPAHSYSGAAANLSLDPRPGGCWCEALPGGGGVEHMRVVYAAPGDTLRMRGGLGPLQALPVSAVLTVTLRAVPGGTDAVLHYAVAGPQLEPLAAPVDAVLAEQFGRLRARAER